MVPISVDEMLRRAGVALQAGNLKFAIDASRAITARAPERGEAWTLLVRALTADGQVERAAAALDAAAKLHPEHPELPVAAAQLLAREGRFDDAIAVCRAILDARPSVEATLLIGMALRRSGRAKESLEVLAPLPPQPAVAAATAATYMALDEPERAIAILAPHLDNSQSPPTMRYNLLHAMGEANEKLERYELAMQYYTAAKSSIPVNFSESRFRTQLALIRDVFTPELLHNAPKPALRSARPVFIAAMPRSGTTLLDRIIASHSQASGAGETRALRAQITEWNATDPAKAWPRIARTFTSADLDRIAGRYLQRTEKFGPDALRISDKHLHNPMMIGLIAMAFPEARIIHLQRDPMDNGISCFERLEPRTVAWSGSLASIALAIRSTNALMQHWQVTCGLPMLTVRYEDLVQDQKMQVARILDFIGLPWDDACMRHHIAKEPSRANGAMPSSPTLGSEQAARPMNDSSIGRAARFGALLDPLRDGLALVEAGYRRGIE